MPDAKFIDDLVARFSALFAASPAKDVEKNVRALLTGAFARLDLVTREEFDIQRELLTRAREKLARLESRLDELEKKDTPPVV